MADVFTRILRIELPESLQCDDSGKNPAFTIAFVADGLGYLQRFLEPVLNLLFEVVSLLGDILGRLASFVTGMLWGWIPKCLRDPIRDFLVNQILRNIPLFSQLLELPDIWARIQQTALKILRQVFVDGNFLAAAWTYFRSLLELFGLPGRLVLNIMEWRLDRIGMMLQGRDRVQDLAEGLLRWLQADGFPPRAVTGGDLGPDWDREIVLTGCRFALAQAREGLVHVP